MTRAPRLHRADPRCSLIWKVTTGRDLPVIGGWDFQQSSPTMADGVLFVGSAFLPHQKLARNTTLRVRGRLMTSA